MKMTASRFRHAVVVAPHPDDEIIGAAALNHELRLHRCKVSVIVVSDGAWSHRSSVRWPPKKLVTERRRESLRALRRLSVLPGHVRFLGLPDGRLASQIDECKRQLARAIRTTASPDLIVGPVFFDDHPDHRAVALALRPAGRGKVSMATASGLLASGPGASAERPSCEAVRSSNGRSSVSIGHSLAR